MSVVQWGIVVAGVLTLGVVGALIVPLLTGSGSSMAADGTLPDWLAIGVSLVALTTSIATVFVEKVQQDRALRITTRDQLTAVTLKLIDTRQELAAFEEGYLKKQAEGVQDYDAYARQAGFLNQKLTSLAQQALQLSRVDTDIAFDVEFIAIGDALMISGHFAGANEAYHNAVLRSPDARYVAINMSHQAGALFDQGDALGGREIYAKSLARLPRDTDINRLTHLETYRRWLNNELGFTEGPSSASEAVRKAGLGLGAMLQESSMKANWAETFLPIPIPASPTGATVMPLKEDKVIHVIAEIGSSGASQ